MTKPDQPADRGRIAGRAALPRRIEPTPDNPMPSPSCSGHWLRDDDGGVRPADETTAADAGLQAPAPAAAPALQTLTKR